jgi:MFS transporter, PPP family, 3-phenylpropionic acid transporter
LLSVLTGATWAAILPLGEAVALGEAQRRDLNYGRVRLWGSIAFILAAIAIGQWLADAGPAIVLWSIAAVAAGLLGACVLLPEGRACARPAAFADFRRLVGTPEFLAFVAAAAMIQVSHAVYYGFATLHWRAAGHGGLAIGLLWAEGVVAEVVLFACAGRAAAPARADTAAGAGRCADDGAVGPVRAQHGSLRAGPGAGAPRRELRRHAPRRHALSA